MGSHCRARILHPAGWSLSPPAIPARQANASLAKATGRSTETPYPVAKAKATSLDRGHPVWRIDADALVGLDSYYRHRPSRPGGSTESVLLPIADTAHACALAPSQTSSSYTDVDVRTPFSFLVPRSLARQALFDVPTSSALPTSLPSLQRWFYVVVTSETRDPSLRTSCQGDLTTCRPEHKLPLGDNRD
ncbi:hypothetical protein BKA56DRAFT_649267 [Ilyonectria sp. MPI-CAGE-AT-0026]|nr:hypothetical protein BKA56DRAFT_649267 [Ilyonectria sp. MPI-CAGE-AT-0026]